MVTPILATRYRCDTCGRKYSDLQIAADCEDSHFALSDFEILDYSKEIARQDSASSFPRSIHVSNQKTDKIASYIFNHDQVKQKPSHIPGGIYGPDGKIPDFYKKPYALFPGEEEDE